MPLPTVKGFVDGDGLLGSGRSSGRSTVSGPGDSRDSRVATDGSLIGISGESRVATGESLGASTIVGIESLGSSVLQDARNSPAFLACRILFHRFTRLCATSRDSLGGASRVAVLGIDRYVSLGTRLSQLTCLS